MPTMGQILNLFRDSMLSKSVQYLGNLSSNKKHYTQLLLLWCETIKNIFISIFSAAPKTSCVFYYLVSQGQDMNYFIKISFSTL